MKRSKLLPIAVMVGPVTVVMLFLVAIPLLYVGVMSFCSIDENYNVVFRFTLDNYRRLLNADYVRIYAQSMIIAALTTILALAIGYPFAYVISRTSGRRKNVLYMLVIIPFWTNSLIRIYGWRTFLGTNGWMNWLMETLRITDEPIEFLFKRGTTVLGILRKCRLP